VGGGRVVGGAGLGNRIQFVDEKENRPKLMCPLKTRP